jgi:hypothetical protein
MNYEKELSPEVREKMKKNLVYVGIFSIIMLFAGFTSAYIVMMGDSFWLKYPMPAGFWLSSASIAMSSLTFILAIRAIKKGNQGQLKMFMSATVLLGILFVYFQFRGYKELISKLIGLDNSGQNVILIGVTYALLDLIEKQKFQLKNTIIMETGGMKGKRKEMIREELHTLLCNGFGVSKIHSEYGMTELLSQAYSLGDGVFECPQWMQVLIRDTEDALTYVTEGKTGGINVIDLANINSCSFIATQDLGKKYPNNHASRQTGSFEVLGRFDNSDIRGCNLMVI